MPVVNEIPGAYERIRAQADALAARLGIQREVIYGYFNETAHFPQTLGELEAWGNQQTKYGVSRRDPATGAWRPIMPGVNPDPRLSALDRGGFPHNFTNAEDSDIQRFQQVDPSGNVFGGSWDPNYNRAHPELAGQPAFQTAQAGLSRGPTAGPQATSRSAQTMGAMAAQARPFDDRNYVAQEGTQWVSYVDGVPVYRNSQAEAEQDYNNRTGGGAAPATTAPGAAPPATTSPGASPGTKPAGDTFVVPPELLTAANTGANNAAMIAYYNKRLELDRDISLRLDEREKQRIALEAARDAATRAHQEATDTGYTGSRAAGQGQAVMDALNGLRSNPQYAAADGATRRQMEAATVAQATGIDTASASQAIERLRSLTATTGQASTPALVESVLGQTPGGAGTPTLARETEQNRATMDALRLLSGLRGPENAFAYADTLANLPESMRQNIQAAMGRLPFTAQNPAQRGFLGDVGVGGGTDREMQLYAAGQQPALGPAPQQLALPPGTGPRTAQQTGGAVQPLTPNQPPVAFDPAQQAAAQQRANALGREIYYPTQQPTGPVFADASRGNPQPGMMYSQVITPAGPQPAGAPSQWRTPVALSPDEQARLRASRPSQPYPLGYGPRTSSAEPFNPSQISPTDYNRTDPYARKLMWAGFEHGGGDIESGQWRYQQSLPRAVGPRTGRYRAA